MRHLGTFLHLSDIHFKPEGCAPNLDGSVRSKLLGDLRSCVADLGGIEGILVSGDIAHSAKEHEYQIAEEWLNKVLKICNTDKSKVVIVPGNHDVDRNICSTATIESHHARLKTARDWHALDLRIGKVYEDPIAIEAIYKPFAAYQKFAILFGCDFSPIPAQVSIEKTILGKGDIKFRIVGINSCLGSDASDDKKVGRKLFVTSHQLDYQKDEKLVNISLCHHPLDWLMEKNTVALRLNGLFGIQLFGHKHTYRALRGGSSLRINAGAVNPERKKGRWLPSYNLFKVFRDEHDKAFVYKIEIIGRVWSLKNNGFEADSRFSRDGIKSYTFTRPKPKRLKSSPTSIGQPRNVQKVVRSKIQVPLGPVLQKELSSDLYYSFLKLPHVAKMEILLDLGVHNEGDRALSELDQYKVGIGRIVKKKLIDRLAQRVKVRS